MNALVFDTFPWPQFGSALEGQQKLAGGRSAAETPGQPSQTPAPRRGVRTASPDPTLCDPSGVVNPDSGSGGVAVAQPPANVSHPAGMLSRDVIAKIDAVAAAARTVRAVRAEALRNLKGGLRALYRTLEWTRSRPLARPSRAFCIAKFLSPFPQTAQVPGANPLKDAHAALDAAVLAAYGFSARKDLLAQLLALNQQVAAKIEKGEPVTAPGVPKNYPDPKKLVTEDCTQPQPTTYPPYEPPNPTPLRKPIPEQAAADAAHFYSAKEDSPPYRTKK